MMWSWRRERREIEEAKNEAVALTSHQKLTGRPEYKVATFICAMLQEHLRKIFGESGGTGSMEAVSCVICEYLYCTFCLTFSALNAGDVLTAKEKIGLVTDRSIEQAEFLLLDPGLVSGGASAPLHQIWDALANEKLRTERPTGYARPADAVSAYAHRTLPILADVLTPEGFLEACPHLYSDMEYQLEDLVFTFPELFRPTASFVVGTVSVSRGYGLGFVEHYSALDARRAEREALRRAEQVKACDMAGKIENFVNSRRGASD